MLVLYQLSLNKWPYHTLRFFRAQRMVRCGLGNSTFVRFVMKNRSAQTSLITSILFVLWAACGLEQDLETGMRQPAPHFTREDAAMEARPWHELVQHNGALDPQDPDAGLAREAASQVTSGLARQVLKDFVWSSTSRHTAAPESDEARTWIRDYVASVCPEEVMVGEDKFVHPPTWGLTVPTEITSLEWEIRGVLPTVYLLTSHGDDRGKDILKKGGNAAPKTERFDGANDNGSGVAGVMVATKILCGVLKQGHRPMHTIRFAVFWGEEEFLLGSEHYFEVRRDQPIQGVINADMIGGLGGLDINFPNLAPAGSPTFVEYNDVIEKVGAIYLTPSAALAHVVQDAFRAIPGAGEITENSSQWVGDLEGTSDHGMAILKGFAAVLVIDQWANIHWYHADNQGGDGDTLNHVNSAKLARAIKGMIAALVKLAWAPLPPAYACRRDAYSWDREGADDPHVQDVDIAWYKGEEDLGLRWAGEKPRRYCVTFRERNSWEALAGKVCFNGNRAKFTLPPEHLKGKYVFQVHAETEECTQGRCVTVASRHVFAPPANACNNLVW